MLTRYYYRGWIPIFFAAQVPAPPQEYRTPKAAMDQDDFNASIIKESQWGENPGSPGKALNQARPPPITHSMKLKRDAIGNLGKVSADALAGLLLCDSAVFIALFTECVNYTD